MRKLFLAATAVAAIAAAAPAAAQYGYQPNPNAYGAAGIDNRIERLEVRLEAGIRAGTINRTEALRLRRDLAELRRLERRYDSGGLTRAEADDLRQRLGVLRQQVRVADRGSWDRYEQSGEWAGYDDDRYGQGAFASGAAGFDQRIARLDARLDAGVRSRQINQREATQLRRELAELSRIERSYGRDGFSRNEQIDLQQRIGAVRQRIRVADRGTWDRYEQSGEWAAYDDPRGFGGRGGPDEALDRWCSDQVSGSAGIGGLIQNLFGLGGLSVGQRVSGNLYAVPSQYRDLFRDGYGVYYRSDGRVVYEIDTDTHVVTRLCRMPG
jgi:hypothetical protein